MNPTDAATAYLSGEDGHQPRKEGQESRSLSQSPFPEQLVVGAEGDEKIDEFSQGDEKGEVMRVVS